MLKVIKVTEDKVFVSNDKGKIVATDKNKFDWEVKVGDHVELFEHDNEIIISKCSESDIVTRELIKSQINQSVNNQYNVTKIEIGVLSSLFLGLLGLIIGICLYPSGTLARTTFIKGWLITYIIKIVAVVIFFNIAIALMAAAI